MKLRPFWWPRVGASDNEWKLYAMKGPVWFTRFKLQAWLTLALYDRGAPDWLIALPAALIFGAWSDWFILLRRHA